MKIKVFKICMSLFLLFSAIGCVTTTPVTETKQSKPKHYEIFISKGYKDGVGAINVTNKFIIGGGNKVYVVVKFMDLVPKSKYKFEFEWFKPNGKMFGTRSVVQKVPDSNWLTGNWLNLDRKYQESYPSGLWSVKVYANDMYIGDSKFFLAHNEAELKEIVELEEKTENTIVRKPQARQVVSNNWAVVIGISKYNFSGKHGLTNLIFADDDAKSFAHSLRNLGWNESHIKLLVNEDATHKNIMIALESWLTKAGPNDQVVLYWSGHGFPDPEDPEKVYFACYDTDISIPVTGYRMDRVRTTLEERKSKNVILLADTCHAGKLITRGERGLSIVPQIDKMSREQRVPKGWIFMVGADTDRQAIEHTSWTNGAFTHSLIKGLSGEADGFQSAGVKDGVVTMGELKDYMNISMPNETQKVLGVAKRPIITTSTGDPDIWSLTLQVNK